MILEEQKHTKKRKNLVRSSPDLSVVVFLHEKKDRLAQDQYIHPHTVAQRKNKIEPYEREVKVWKNKNM